LSFKPTCPASSSRNSTREPWTTGPCVWSRAKSGPSSVGRLVTPLFEDWKKAGKLVALITRREPGRKPKVQQMLNDILLALSARRMGADLYTLNRENFKLIRRKSGRLRSLLLIAAALVVAGLIPNARSRGQLRRNSTAVRAE